MSQLADIYRRYDSIVIGIGVSIVLVVGLAALAKSEQRERMEVERLKVAELARSREIERQQAVKRLTELQELSRIGKTIEKMRIRHSIEGSRLRITIWNDTEYEVSEVRVTVSNSKRWKAVQNERYNGVRVADMGTTMNPEWLKKTGHYEQMQKLRNDSHKYFDLRGPFPRNYYKQIVIDLPESMVGTNELSVAIESARDSGGTEWSSRYKELIAESLTSN